MKLTVTGRNIQITDANDAAVHKETEEQIAVDVDCSMQ